MASKLAWHFQSIPWWAREVVNSEWVKLIDPPSVNLFPGSRTIGRIYVPDEVANSFIEKGAQGAHEWFALVDPRMAAAPYVYVWELPNEPPVQTALQRRNLVDFTERAVFLMHQAKRRTAALCLSVGWPDVGKAAELKGALATTDFWALHEYSAPSMMTDEGWLCLRYRRTVEELRACNSRIPPLLITECGIDGGVINRGRTGWRTFASRPEYLGQLQWYDGELGRDDYVQAATIFTSGPNQDWIDFDVDEPASRDLSHYIDSKKGASNPTYQEDTPVVDIAPNFRLARPLPNGIGGVTQWYGENVAYYRQFGLEGHEGIDYGTEEGQPVLAAHSGRVHIETDPFYGLHIHLYGNGHDTVYGHLSEVIAAEGQVVKTGDTIGKVGNTGNSRGPHLHFGWRVDDVREPARSNFLNPLLGRKLNGDA